jgi:ubiquinone/menaquinone biosynthesis C-methylase UbiE
LCREALGSSTSGWVLDAGCGSLAFTAEIYSVNSERPVVFLDRSVRLLRIAKSRLAGRYARVPDNRILLQADVRRLPFEPGCIGTLISLNLLHVFPDGDLRQVLTEMKRVLSNTGALYLTTLVENNRWADGYLRMWGRAGELVPRNADRLRTIFDEIGWVFNCRTRGNLAFISAR